MIANLAQITSTVTENIITAENTEIKKLKRNGEKMIKSQSKGKNLSVKIKHTAKNKIRNIIKQLKTATGNAIQKLTERLNFWKTIK